MKLKQVDLTKKLADKEYKHRLKQGQYRLLQVQQLLFKHRIPVIFVFEGWDAAGKGGAIKRLTEQLDPRGYVVHPIAAPTADEKQYHYLYRFWRKVPPSGKVAIFDRSWYGRVLVERVEQFALKAEWKVAYSEINDWEATLTNQGYFIMKFWFHISKDEQLKRFKDRENNPLKRWKITEEDWRNRAKWDDYVEAVEDMLEKTSTSHAQWHVIPGNDKQYARVQTLELVLAALEAKLAERGIDVDRELAE